MNNFYFEAINPYVRQPKNIGSRVNQLKIQKVTARKDGLHEIHVKFNGRNRSIPIDIRKSTRPSNMIFRDSNGFPVDPSLIVQKLCQKSENK